MSELTNRTAAKLLRQALKILSEQNNCKIELEVFADAEVCLVTAEREVASINNTCYFKSAAKMLESLMTPGTKLSFHPKMSSNHFDRICIDFAAQFGSTIAALKINLDLLNSNVNGIESA